MLPTNNLVAGVDVSKSWLDVSFRGQHSRYKNNIEGIKALKELLSDSTLVVCEASGGYESLLAESRLPVAIVSATRVRALAKAQGKLCKTDKIDASLIAFYGTVMNPKVTTLGENRELRRQLSLIRTLQNNRLRLMQLEEHGVYTELNILKKTLEETIAKAEDEIQKLLQDHPSAVRLMSVPCVGMKLTAHLIALLPELGKVSSREIAALAGVAPFVRESGQWQGKRFISGGRKDIRNVLYMAALAGIRCNPLIRETYQSLKTKGKAAKVAIVACMRKLLVLLNTLEKEQRYWKDTLASQS